MAVVKEFTKGLWKEMPPFRLVLGLCPTLAVTTSAENGLGMGAAVIFVLTLSNMLVSMMRHFIPKTVRIACFIVIAASLVVSLELLMQAYAYGLYEQLGIFVPLIVVNCIILGRAEAYANKHTPMLSVMDGLGMGIGFTLALTLAGLIREILGNGTAFGAQILPKSVDPIGIFVQPPGAFLVIAFIIAIMNAIGIKTRQRKLVEEGCDGVCGRCSAACDKKEGGEAK